MMRRDQIHCDINMCTELQTELDDASSDAGSVDSDEDDIDYTDSSDDEQKSHKRQGAGPSKRAGTLQPQHRPAGVLGMPLQQQEPQQQQQGHQTRPHSGKQCYNRRALSADRDVWPSACLHMHAGMHTHSLHDVQPAVIPLLR